MCILASYTLMDEGLIFLWLVCSKCLFLVQHAFLSISFSVTLPLLYNCHLHLLAFPLNPFIVSSIFFSIDNQSNVQPTHQYSMFYSQSPPSLHFIQISTSLFSFARHHLFSHFNTQLGNIHYLRLLLSIFLSSSSRQRTYRLLHYNSNPTPIAIPGPLHPSPLTSPLHHFPTPTGPSSMIS
ncbi:hypothetical protein K474DRAFT_571445 [Panus rudis PR-1116 ss-1]|nr:hypothetical protein K474DRAFT_571445 [Panus rudis PR-1116 ss-1]